jgi:hypothetical protein
MTAAISIKVNLDSSGVISGVAQVNGQIAQIGQSAQQHLGQATHAVQEHGKAWEATGGQIVDVLKDIAVAAGLAFSVDKLVEWVHAAIEGAERIQNLSQSLGVSTQNLQTFNYAANLSQTSLDAVSGSLSRLERAQVEARDGNQQTAAAFAAVGVSATLANGALKPADQLIVELAQHLSHMSDGATKIAVIMQLMGRGAAENIPFLNALGQEYNKLRKEAEELGVVLTDKQQKALLETNEEMDKLGQEVKGLGNQFALALLPVIKQVVQELAELGRDGGIRTAFQSIAAAAKLIVDNFGLIRTVAATLVEIKIATWALDGAAGLVSMAKEAASAETRLLSLKGAVGVVGAAIVGWNIGTYLRENFVEAQNFGERFVQFMLTGWIVIKSGAEAAWIGLKLGFVETVDTMKSSFGSFLEFVASGLDKFSGIGFISDKLGGPSVRKEIAELTASLHNANPVVDEYKKQLAEVGDQLVINTNKLARDFDAQVAWNNGQAAAKQAVAQAVASQGQLNDIVERTTSTFAEAQPGTQSYANLVQHLHEGEEQLRQTGDRLISQGADKATVNKLVQQSVEQLDKSFENATRSTIKYNSEQASSQHLQQEQAKDLAAYQTTLDSLTGKLNGPYVKAQTDYNTVLVKAHEQYQKDIQDHVASATAKEREKEIDQAALAVRDNELKQLKEQHDLIAQTNADLNNQLALQGVAPQYQQALTDGLKQYDELLKSHFDFYGNYIVDADKLRSALDAQLPTYINLKQRINDMGAAQKNQEAIQKEWQDIVSNGFQSVGSTIGQVITGGIKNWHDFWQSLLGDAKQFVAAIIQEMLKLTVFNGITNSLFGLSGSSALPTGLGNGILGGIFGGGSGGGGVSLAGNVAQGGINLANPSGPSAAGGTSGGSFNLLSPSSWLSMGQNLGSGFADAASSFWSGSVGNPASANFVGPPVEGQTYGAAPMGGFAQAASIAGAVYAGISEYKAAGGGVAGAAGGATYAAGTYALGAGLTSVAAGTGFAAGVSGAFAAIPVIGWIALAAMAINMISGGKLFGTAGKVIGGSRTETVTSSGVDLSSEYTTKGQRALFGGSYYKEHNLAVDPAQQAAQDAFFQSLVDQKTDFATSLGQIAGAIIGGTFVETFDKKGKSTGTTTTIGGQTYKGETGAQFEERLQAANLSDVMSQMGINIGAFTKSVQGDADKLLAAVQDAGQATLAATHDIAQGISLLGADGSVADVINEVIKLDNNNEALSQKYAELQISTQTLRVDLLLAHDAANMTGTALVEFADKAAKAAGGAQQLAQLIQKFDNVFYNATQQSAVAVQTMREKIGKEFAAIGEDPNESLDQFKQDFDRVRDSLSPEDLVKWYQAGVDLGQLNDMIKQTADTAAAAVQKYADFEVQTQGDSFVQAFAGAIKAMAQQISTANQLAVAAGKAGASQRDLATAVNAGSVVIGKAVAELTQGILTDVQTLFGNKNDFFTQTGWLDTTGGSAANQQAQLQKAQTTSVVFDLIQKLGDFGFASSAGSVDDILKEFGITADQLGAKIGESGDQVRAQIKAEQDQAGALVSMDAQGKAQTGLLTDILETLQGKATTFDINGLSTDLGVGSLPVSGGKVTGGTRIVPSPNRVGGTQQVGTTQTPAGTPDAATQPPSVSLNSVPNVLKKNNDELLSKLDEMISVLGGLRTTINRHGLTATTSLK